MQKGERHGTRWTYKHYGCRCDLCVTGKRASDKRYRDELRAGLRKIVLPPEPSPPPRTLPHAFGPYVPAAIILRLLEPMILESSVQRVGRMCAFGERGLYEIRRGHRQLVRFSSADQVICKVLGHPELWWEIPELRAIYEAA